MDDNKCGASRPRARGLSDRVPIAREAGWYGDEVSENVVWDVDVDVDGMIE